jgi:DNA topoisomerase I
VMDYHFTAQVEDWLDDVSRGERDWVKALRDFYDPFAAALASAPPKMAAFKRMKDEGGRLKAGNAEEPARQTARRQRASRKPKKSSGQASSDSSLSPYPSSLPVCPRCGSPMVKRSGPRGEFWGCSTFPKCKGTRSV